MSNVGIDEIEEIQKDAGKEFRGREKVRVLFHRPKDGASGLPLNREKTREAGYPVYEDEVWCRRFVDEDNIMDGPILTFKPEHEHDPSPFNDYDSKVSKHHCDSESGDFRKIWPRAFAAFQRGDAEQIIGYRLESFFVNEPSRVEIWKHFGVRTVEALSELTDATVGKILGGAEDRDKARLAMETIRGARPVMALTAKQSELEAENASLKDEMSEMRAMIAELLEAKAAAKKGGKGQKAAKTQEDA